MSLERRPFLKWTREEILHLIALRHGAPEGVGEGSMLEFHFRISPELVEEIMGGELVFKNGRRSKLTAIYVDDTGYIEPVLTELEPAK